MTSPVQTTRANKVSKPITERTATASEVFTKILSSIEGETKETSPEQPAEADAELSGLFETLQELLQKELTPEQEELTQTVVQLLSLQQINSTNEQHIESLDQPQFSALLQQLQQNLSPSDNAKTGMPVELTESKTEQVAANSEKIEQAIKQLTQLIKELESVQSAAGKPSVSVPLKKLEQVLMQFAESIQRSASLESLKETAVKETVNQELGSIQVSVTDKTHKVGSETAAQKVETVSTTVTDTAKTALLETTNQKSEPVPTTPVEGTKANGTAQVPLRTETPVPVIRMANLAADLSEVLRGSMRLTGSGESAQIKVSIFPEHLGHLDIRLTTTDGKIAAHIFTSSLMAKEALDLQLTQLRTTLLQQGVDLDRIEITQQSAQHSFGQQNANPEQGFTQQKKQSTANKNAYQRIDEEVAAVKERNRIPDGLMIKVDYTI